jgi:hypothetical protein
MDEMKHRSEQKKLHQHLIPLSKSLEQQNGSGMGYPLVGQGQSPNFMVFLFILI